ncbi:hypothetical protein CP336_00550 [Pseudomonas fluorescens]|jgi:hypothetical protein|nr:hypothetical protein CP336_00550 [Pseudomonas fluorescens]
MPVRKVIVGLPVYLLVGALYFFVHDFGVVFYKAHMGGFTDRGVGTGITAELTFYFFIVVNAAVFFMPWHSIKLGLIAVMVGVIMLYFLPDNPVRAMAYSALTSVMSLLALSVRWMVEQQISRRWQEAP